MEYKITKKFTKERIDEIIQIKNNKGLTAESILDAAKHKKSSLHNLFDWDNSKAGEKWRLHQARMLVNEVIVIVDTKEFFAFENASVFTDNLEIDKKREYFTHDEIITNEQLRQQIIHKALESLIYWRNKYSHYKEFATIITEIDKVQKIIEENQTEKIFV